MIILKDAEKEFDKNLILIHNKNSLKTRNRNKHPQLNRKIKQKTYS